MLNGKQDGLAPWLSPLQGGLLPVSQWGSGIRLGSVSCMVSEQSAAVCLEPSSCGKPFEFGGTLATEPTATGLLLAATFGLAVVAVAVEAVRDLYRKHLFWKYVKQDSDVGHPLKLCRLYHAQNTERGENR